MADVTTGGDPFTDWLNGRSSRRSGSRARVATPTNGVRFAFYGRVSTSRFQDAVSSRAWQRERAQELIADHGVVVAEFFDRGCSRRTPWAERPAAAQLLGATAGRHRSFDAIVVGEYERAFVGDQLLALLPVLDRCGVRLWLPEAGGPVDGRDPEHRALIRVLGAQSRREVARARFRVLAAMRAQVVDQGRYLGGRPPYGYRLADAGPHPNGVHAEWGRRLHRLVPDSGTASWVRWIFVQRLSGRSIAGIARVLNERGVACPSGADPERNRHRRGSGWTVQTVAAILANPRYTGRQVWNRQGTDRDRRRDQGVAGGLWRGWNPAGEWLVSRVVAHEPLVSEENFVAVQKVSALEVPQDGSVRTYLLVGLVLCGICFRRLESCWVHGRPGYRCRHGHASSKPARPARPKNLYLRQDRIVERIRADVLALDGRPAAEDVDAIPAIVVEVLRSRQLVIVCDASDCRVASADSNVTLKIA